MQSFLIGLVFPSLRQEEDGYQPLGQAVRDERCGHHHQGPFFSFVLRFAQRGSKQELEVVHPAAKMLVLASEMQARRLMRCFLSLSHVFIAG
jgi:hypothetical protein